MQSKPEEVINVLTPCFGEKKADWLFHANNLLEIDVNTTSEEIRKKLLRLIHNRNFKRMYRKYNSCIERIFRYRVAENLVKVLYMTVFGKLLTQND